MSQRPRLPILMVCVLIALPATLVVHECGQTVVARLTGDRSATLRLSAWRPSGAVSVGSAKYDATKLTSVGRVLVPLSGLLWTQCAALGLLLVSARWPQRPRAYAATIAGTFALDATVQVARAIASEAAWGPYPTGVDLADIAHAVFGLTGLNVLIVEATLVVGALLSALAMGGVVRRRLRGRSWAA